MLYGFEIVKKKILFIILFDIFKFFKSIGLLLYKIGKLYGKLRKSLFFKVLFLVMLVKIYNVDFILLVNKKDNFMRKREGW